MGLELMREVAFFKERVFTLKGDISYILQRERGSRNGACCLLRWLLFWPSCLITCSACSFAAAESANSRVKWLSLITNVVLVGIALAQVLYIRSMLENSY